MLFPYVAGMLTMFSLVIFKEMMDVPKINQNFYISNNTYIFMEDYAFPYETIYLRATADKYKEYETILYKMVNEQMNPVCKEQDYKLFLNQSQQMCYD
jgi:hypothetical protein